MQPFRVLSNSWYPKIKRNFIIPKKTLISNGEMTSLAIRFITMSKIPNYSSNYTPTLTNKTDTWHKAKRTNKINYKMQKKTTKWTSKMQTKMNWWQTTRLTGWPTVESVLIWIQSLILVVRSAKHPYELIINRSIYINWLVISRVV